MTLMRSGGGRSLYSNWVSLLRTFATKPTVPLEIKNELIVKKHPFVRLIDRTSGKLLESKRSEEIFSTRPDNFDLILVDSRQDPPIVRLQSSSESFKLIQQREEAATRARLANKLKEMHVTTVTGEHDFDVKISRVEEWINKGWRVKIVVEEKKQRRILGKGINQPPPIDAKREIMSQIVGKLAGQAEIVGIPEIERGCLLFTLNPTQKILSKLKQERKN